jgi:hypothetical protein
MTRQLNYNINGFGKKQSVIPNFNQLDFYWKGRFDGNDLINEVGTNIPYISGSGLDAIYDFEGLGDIRLDKSNSTYWTQPLDAYFYLDVGNPYHFKLKDFHYMRIEGACPSSINVFFAKGTYSEVDFDTSELLIYQTEQTGNNLNKLFNYINIKYELASDYGFLPTATASENVAAWASIPEYSFITVDQVGIYEINDTLWTESNTVFDFNAGCVIKKTGDDTVYTHTIANKGISTLVRNNNIKIYGNGLIINQNGINGITASLSYRMRGEINFFRVDKFIADGLNFTDGLNPIFFVHVADINNFRFRNISVKSEKDGIHFNAKCHNGIIEDIYTDTNDDPMAWIVTDYIDIMACVGNISNITVNRWTHDQDLYTNQSARVISGSWAVWNNGNTYNKTDLCVNNGIIYVKRNIGADIASVAPVHTSGSVTGADGITWEWLQVGTETEGNITNITINNSDFEVSSQIISNEGTNSDDLRSIYPGTEGNAYTDNFTFDNIRITTTQDDTKLWAGTNFIKTLTVKNTTLSTSHKFYLMEIGTSPGVSFTWFEELILDNVDIYLSNALSYIYISLNTDSRLDKFTLLNSSNIKGVNSTPLLYLNQLDYALIELDDSILENILAIVDPSHSYDMDITATNCEFKNLTSIIDHITVSPAAINYTSTGCTYTNPLGDYLFDANRTGLTIDITESNGDIDQNKISQEDVIITRCDLYDAIPVSSMAMVVNDNQMYINIDGLLDNFTPDKSAFTISGKTISSVSLDGSFVILVTTTDFTTEDTPTVTYVKPSVNYLRTLIAATVRSFSDMVINIWDEDTDNLKEEYDYLDEDSITKDGSNRVSKWEGQSVNNYYLEQTGIDSLKPTLTANGVLFDGVAQWLQSINFTLSSSSIIYMVFKQVTWTVNDRILTSGAGILWLFQWGETPKLRANGTTLIANSTLPVDTFKTMRLLGNASNSFMQFDFETEEVGDISLATTLGFILGSQNAGSTPSNIEVKGIVIRDNADDLDYQIGMMRRLSKRYGLTI